MKIIIKTLQGKQLPLEVEEADTVSTRGLIVMIDQTSKRKDWNWAQDGSRLAEIDRVW